MDYRLEMEQALELDSGPGKLGFGSTLRDLEFLGNLLMTQPIHHKKLKYSPISIWKLGKHFSQILPIQAVIRKRGQGWSGQLFEIDFSEFCPLFLQVHQAFIDYNSSNPAFKTSLLAELGNSAEYFSESDNQYILGGSCLLDVPEAKGKHLRRQPLKKLPLIFRVLSQAPQIK